MSDAGRGDGEDIGVPGLADAEFVGRGGAAVVYRARQTSLQRTVAIKLLTSAWDDSVARRFDREQRAMGRLSSQPGIVPVYESGVNDSGVPYIIMPYYPNGSLKDYSEREGPIRWERAAELILQIAEAVGGAHDRGVVHRDLKPANILLSATGRPLVADFGIARLASDGVGIATTAVAFTPAYCPPEVLDESEPAPQADTYALAATFWALVRGRPPFTDSDTVLGMEAVLKRVLTEPPPRLDEVPPPIAAFIDRAMSKLPEDRPEDGHTFADQLREAIDVSNSTGSNWGPGRPDDETIVRSTPRAGTPEPSAEPIRQKRLKLAAIFALFLVLAVTFSALLWTRNETATDSAADEASAAATSSPVIVAAGERVQVLPLATSADSMASQEARRSAELAMADVGLIQGFDIELLPPLVVPCEAPVSDLVETAIETTNAVVLVGTTCPESARSVMEVAAERQISWISEDVRLPSLTADAVGAVGTDYVAGFFRTAQNDQFQGSVAAQFAIQDLGAESAVILLGDFAGAREIADAFVASFHETGDVIEIDMAATSELSGPVGEWAAADADVAFWVLDADTALALAEATEDQAGTAGPRIAIGDVLTTSTAQQSVMTGTFIVVPQVPAGTATAATGRTLDELIDDYEDAFGEQPENLLTFASAYDAMALALGALRDTAAISDDEMTLDRDALRRNLETAASDGLTGAISCNIFGDCGSQALAIVEADGTSEASTLDNVVKLFTKES